MWIRNDPIFKDIYYSEIHDYKLDRKKLFNLKYVTAKNLRYIYSHKLRQKRAKGEIC